MEYTRIGLAKRSSTYRGEREHARALGDDLQRQLVLAQAHGNIQPKHPPTYLDEFSFRRAAARSRSLSFFVERIKKAQSVLAPCIRPLGWWRSELYQLLPKEAWRAILRPRRIVGILETTQFVLLETIGNTERQLLRIGSNECEFAADLDDALSRMKRRGLGVILRLGTELGLRKVLKLPVAARNDLDQLLRFEMDRLSPFAVDEVYFAHRTLQVVKSERCLLVEVHIVPRATVERALATCRCLGLEPKHLEFAGAEADTGLNLLPEATKKSCRTSVPDRVLAVLALVLAGWAVLAPLQKQRATAADLERQVVIARDEADRSLSLRQQLETLMSTMRFTIHHKRSTPRVTNIVAELTRRIDDDAYLVELHITEDHVRLRGYSQSASATIKLLEGPPMFQKAGFTSPITRDFANKEEHFQILIGLQGRDD